MKFQNIVLIGGGVLGSQIAYQTAYAGFHTTVYLRSEASVERAKPKVARLHEIYRAELTAARPAAAPGARAPTGPGGPPPGWPSPRGTGRPAGRIRPSAGTRLFFARQA